MKLQFCVVKMLVNLSNFKLTRFFQKHTRECTAIMLFAVRCCSFFGRHTFQPAGSTLFESV